MHKTRRENLNAGLASEKGQLLMVKFDVVCQFRSLNKLKYV